MVRQLLLFLPYCLLAQVTVLFNPQDQNVGPYPSGERPNFASPACPAAPTLTPDCAERERLGKLDGFALEPLLRVRFSGPVRRDTLRDGVYLIWGEARHRSGFSTYPAGHKMPINQLMWDPRTNSLYAKPEEALEHDRDYYLVVTTSLRDLAGNPVVTDARFTAPVPALLGPGVVAFTTFHTMNVTRSLLETDLGRAGTLRRTHPRILDLADVQRWQVLLETNTAEGAALREEAFPPDVETLRSLGLRRLAFFDYLNARGERVAGHAWLPETPAPPGGYPVLLIGHGLGDQRMAGPAFFAGSFVAGAAVVSINAVGHGYGAKSVVRVGFRDGTTAELPLPGRGVDADRSGTIDAFEGCVVFELGSPAFIRDCLRETALDYRKLVREIEAGVDLDGDGQRDLDPNRIQYLGQSLGAMYGSILLGIEGNIEGGVLNVGAGSTVEAARYSPALRAVLALYLSVTHPEVLTGFLQLPDPLLPRFADVLELSDARTGPYLEYLDRVLMLETEGAPASFAPFFKQATLYGNGIKRVLFQYAVGDQTLPNPANSQLIRAAFEYELVSAYRHDLAKEAVPSLPSNSHTYLAAFVEQKPETLSIGIAALTQAAVFLASGRREVPDVNVLVRPLFGRDLFEVPKVLPETPGFVR